MLWLSAHIKRRKAKEAILAQMEKGFVARLAKARYSGRKSKILLNIWKSKIPYIPKSLIYSTVNGEWRTGFYFFQPLMTHYEPTNVLNVDATRPFSDVEPGEPSHCKGRSVPRFFNILLCCTEDISEMIKS